MAKREKVQLYGIIDQLTRTHWENVSNMKLRKIESIMNMTEEQFQETFGKSEESEKPTIEIYYDQFGIRDGKVGCIRARLRDDHRIHAAGINEEEAVIELMSTLKSFSRPSKRDDYFYEGIVNVQR
jgi:hypothetical protein